MRWERLAGRPLALEGLHGLRPRRRLLGRQFVFRRRRLQLFQLKLHLLQQSRLLLRARAVKLPAQLLDLEPVVGDQRFRAGIHRLRASRNGFGFQARSPLGKDHRMRGGKIGW